MKKIFVPFLIASIMLSCSKDAVQNAAADEKPLSAEFKFSSNDVYENQNVVLTPVTVNTSHSYHWSVQIAPNKFIPIDEKSPSISYKMHGVYNIILTVTNNKGETATSSQMLPVMCNYFGSGPHP